MENRYERGALVVSLLIALAVALTVCLVCFGMERTEKEAVPQKAVLVRAEGAGCAIG